MDTFIVWSFILIGAKEKKSPLGCIVCLALLAQIWDWWELNLFPQLGFLRTFNMLFWTPHRNDLCWKNLLQLVLFLAPKWVTLPGLQGVFHTIVRARAGKPAKSLLFFQWWLFCPKWSNFSLPDYTLKLTKPLSIMLNLVIQARLISVNVYF